MEKYYNGVLYRYYDSISPYNRRWMSTHKGYLLAHAVWNVNNPSDIILPHSGYIIHHINKEPSDDRIENLMKMLAGEHISIHHTKWTKDIDMYAKKLRELGYSYIIIASRISNKFSMSISSVAVGKHISSVVKGIRKR